MLKQIIQIWKSIMGYKNLPPKLSPEEMEEGRLFVKNSFENKEYQALGRAFKADPIKYKIPSEFLVFLEKNLKNEFETQIFTSPTLDFFSSNPSLLSPESFLNIFKMPLTVNFSQEIFRQNILAKNSDFIKLDKLTEQDFAIKRTCEFLIAKANTSDVKNQLIQRFSDFLKNGTHHQNEEVLFCISAPTLAHHFKLSDIQKSPHANNRLIRTYFSEFREIAEAQAITSRGQEAPAKPVEEKIKPFTLDTATINSLPTNIKKKYEEIIVLVNKFKNSRIPNDHEDSYFLKKLVDTHLPEAIFQYLQIDVSYRDQVFSSIPKTATEITNETLDLYLKRLNKIGENLSEAALNKLNANKLLIQRMSQNITFYNQGITEVPDELEIQAPEIDRPLVKIRKP